MRLACLGVMAFFALSSPALPASAHEKHPPAKTAQTKPPAEENQKKEQLVISKIELALLIKSSVIALQQANQTGNYSVLRDLGTPVFRERFDQAKLTAIFSSLRARNINLSPALLLAPNLVKPPEITPQHQLHLAGNFPTQPLQIQFELLFLRIDGMWRIDGISVDATPVQAMAAVSSGNASPTNAGGQPNPSTNEQKPVKQQHITK